MVGDYDRYRRLALATVEKAIEDACKGDTLAKKWLLTVGIGWLQLAGIEVEIFKIEASIGGLTGEKLKRGISNTCSKNRMRRSSTLQSENRARAPQARLEVE